MFDIGFSEMMLVGIVALVVIGPERMPGVARTAGALFGRAQRYVGELKADIQKQVDLEELKNIKSTFDDAARSFEQSVIQAQEQLDASARSLNPGVAAQAPTPVDPSSIAQSGDIGEASAALPCEDAEELVQIPVTVSLMHSEVDPEELRRIEATFYQAPEPAAAADETQDTTVQMDFWLGATPVHGPSAAPGA
ncbi:MAG: twin-arginine translocase subunit TatB [Burkholderiales bacterium]|nr:twin-arginine translocase subunit TatB [Burkholderiales bacterium]